MSEKLEREIVFFPAWNKTSNDPKKNYGINGVDLAFYLTGELGVIQFKIMTNWLLPMDQEYFDSKPLSSEFPCLFHKPLPSDLGYHSYQPKYEGQKPITQECPLLNWKPCYYDGSTLNAENVFKTLCTKGSEGVWKELEEYYHSIFDEAVAK